MKLHSPDAARRLPIGAELLADGRAAFRVWAPARQRVRLVIEGEAAREVDLKKADGGYFETLVDHARPGLRYRYRLDDEETLRPDPASRFQPNGCEGPSVLIDPSAYRWRDEDWSGCTLRRSVVYEMHIGTFTAEGTWEAAAKALPWLADLGITVLEIMPVGEFPGRFGWGYDVVHHYAPTHLYGTADDMRAFVETAHGLGMGVILDVVYNHCSSVGCFIQHYAPEYFTDRYKNDWGNAFNYDGPGCGPVREYVLSNAEYWVREFHVDGFRLDATQSMYDSSTPHIISELGERARAAAGSRTIVLFGENEPQDIGLTRRAAEGGGGLDALWNDDFHHSARVAMTGRREAYYLDYRGTPQELIAAVKWGFLYQGQYYSWQRKRRGSVTLHSAPERFVLFLQNHDQVANSSRGLRLHELTDRGRWRACTALMLLAPGTPLLFQGQEFAASAPFLYFADNTGDMARVVREGRQAFLSQFQSIASGGDAWLADPASRASFERSKLDLSERETHAHAVALHRDLIALKRDDPVFANRRPRGVDGAVLAEEAFVLRFFAEGGAAGDRLLLVNLGREVHYAPMPEPLLVPPPGSRWKVIWSSTDVRYGGDGTPDPCPGDRWIVAARAALVLAAEGTADE